MKTVPPSRSETLAKALLTTFFGVNPQARQPAEMLLPLVPALVDGQVMLKATLPASWRRSDPGVPQVRTASIAARLARERPKRTRVVWLRKAAPADWRRDLLKLVDDYEAGRVQFHPAGIVCNGDWCWASQLAMSGR
jgi:hypothetical protein